MSPGDTGRETAVETTDARGDGDYRTGSDGREDRQSGPRGGATVGVGVAGAAATVAVVVGLGALPVLALAVGAAVVLLAGWRLRADQAVAGTLFVLGVGFSLAALPDLTAGTPGYTRWTPLVLVAVGGLYALFLLAKFVVKAVVRAVGRRYADADLVAELWDVGASLVSLLYLVWQALSFAERVARSVAVAVVGPSMVAVNLYLTLAEVVSETVVDLSTLAFVVALVLGFHTLSTWSRAAGLVRRWGRREPRTASATESSTAGETGTADVDAATDGR